MATRYRFGDNERPHFITFSIVNWIDVFSRETYKEVFIESLQYCITNKGLVLHAWVIMSNHLHLIVFTEKTDLSDVLRDFKKFTAHKILESIREEPESRREWLLHLFGYFAKANTTNRNFQFWQSDNHPIALWSLPVSWQKLDYIHMNPVRAGIVSDQTHYLYSSAGVYFCAKKGLLEVDLMEGIGPVLPTNYNT